MHYRIIRTTRLLDGSTAEDQIGDDFGYLDDATRALKRILAMSAPLPNERITIRRCWTDYEMEHARIHGERHRDMLLSQRSGEYEALPQSVLARLPSLRYPVMHIQASDGTPQLYVHYYASDEDLLDGKPTTTRLGRLLSQQAGMASHDVHHLVQQVMADRLAADYSITADKDTIREAFIDNPMRSESSGHESCMRHTFGVPAEFHPCNAYGGNSDLRLAVMRRKSDNRLVARSVVWPEQQGFVRTYGLNETLRHAIASWLQGQGFKRVPGFAGAKIVPLQHPHRRDALIVPYVDGATTACQVDGTLLERTRLGMTTIPVQNAQCIYIRRQERMQICDVCSAQVPARTMSHARIGGVTRDHDRLVQVCDTCATARARYCTYYSILVMDHMTVDVCVNLRAGNTITQTWSTPAAERHAFYCDVTQTYYARNFTPVQVRLPNGADVQGCLERLSVRHDEQTDVTTLNMRSPRMRTIAIDRGWLTTPSRPVATTTTTTMVVQA